jgi:hypothetical protein
MTDTRQRIYSSQNGDRWWLIWDDATGRKVVRHEANQSSGGHCTDTDAEEFLRQAGSGPEYAALRLMLDAEEDID